MTLVCLNPTCTTGDAALSWLSSRYCSPACLRAHKVALGQPVDKQYVRALPLPILLGGGVSSEEAVANAAHFTEVLKHPNCRSVVAPDLTGSDFVSSMRRLETAPGVTQEEAEQIKEQVLAMVEAVPDPTPRPGWLTRLLRRRFG